MTTVADTSSTLPRNRAHIARRAGPRLGIVALGRIAAAALILGAVAVLARLLGEMQPDDLTSLIGDEYLHRVIRFTLVQAGLSTLLSVLLAVPVARALARQSSFSLGCFALGRIPLRGLLLRLFSLPLVMPSLVAIFGVVDIYGQQGLVAHLADPLSQATGWAIAWPSIYGLSGILIAHVFFNLPLAVRLLLPAWGGIPAETWRLAAQLGMSGGQVFRLIEVPLLRRALPQIAATVFMLCFTSFAIVLTLGGGPRASTMEVAIFQAIRFDADLPRAGLLALVELGLCLAVGLACRGLARRMDLGGGFGRPLWRHDATTRIARWGDGAWIAFAALFIVTPEAALLLDGLAGFTQALPWRALVQAAALGLGLSLTAGSLATLTGFLLAGAATAPDDPRSFLLRAPRRLLRRIAQSGQALAGLLPLAFSPMVLGMGLYLWISDAANSAWLGGLFGGDDPDSLAADLWPVAGIILLNAAMAVPYTMTLLLPALDRARSQHDTLCLELGISGWRRFTLIDWPVLRPQIGTAMALATSLGLGDLVGISLFGNPDLKTLGILLYEQLGAYRLSEAATTALLLLVTVLIVYSGLERLIGGKAGR
ncbi:MAG TPA: ABC transporter permease subunit [Dongiaceae bacterium]|nr:ABC transporter permease subunit [Dongiaceae bacterium]